MFAFRLGIVTSVLLAVLGHRTPGQDGLVPPAPQIVAHRGLFKHAPENTLAAFGACFSLRCGFELDVRRTKDGHLVCMHDEDVRRTTNGNGKVSEFTLADLRKLDAGGWFDPAFAGERVPTLAEMFAMLKDGKAKSVLIALDIKEEDENMAGDIAKLADQHGLGRQLVCIGQTINSANLRRRLRAIGPRLGIAVLAQQAEDLEAALAEKNADWIYIRFLPTPEQSARIHAASKRTFLAGPLVAGNEPDNWRRARAAHVDAVLTDYPLTCREAWRQK
jgi:glycerophosphoryl diester phosphodiesterase